jgi:RNA polymerase sigma-70 factor (ECF subfamily)
LPEFHNSNKSSYTDAQLLEYFRINGDPEIIGELYSRYMHLVYGVCLKYLENREEAKDSVMQIFEKLIHELPKYEIQNFKSWLHVLTKNFCLMKIRSDKSVSKREKIYLKDEVDFMESGSEMHPIDDDEIDQDKALSECIERLKAEQKDCIELFYYGNKCYSEIAVILDIDEKKVKSYLQNGKRNLKICLEEKNVR